MSPEPCVTSLPNVNAFRFDGHKEHDQKATPSQGTAMPTGGLAGRKEHDRLVETVDARAQVAPVAICPNCGLTANNGVLVRSELTTAATYLCTEAHIFSVTWMENA